MKAGKETTLKQWTDFFVVCQCTLQNHTGTWLGTELLPFAIASSSREVGQVFACWLLRADLELEDDESSVVDDTVHCCKIDLKQWQQSIKDCGVDPEILLVDDYILQNNIEGIKRIAEGTSLWPQVPDAVNDDVDSDDDNAEMDVDEDADITKLRDLCSALILPHKHHGQSTEAGVKDIGTCTDTKRNEIEASGLSSFRSMVNMFVTNQLSKLMKSRGQSRGNRHRDSNGAARSNQARKQDNLGIDREPKAKPTKGKATMLIREALKLVVHADVWTIAKKRKG